MKIPSAQPPTRPKSVILDYYPTLPTQPTTPLTPKNIALTEPKKETNITTSTIKNMKKIREKTPVQKTQSPIISKKKSVKKMVSENMKNWLKSGSPKLENTSRRLNSVQKLIMMHEKHGEDSTDVQGTNIHEVGSNTRSGDHPDSDGADRLI